MDREMIDAIEASIEHWEELKQDPTSSEPNCDSCALCELAAGTCDQCPLYKEYGSCGEDDNNPWWNAKQEWEYVVYDGKTDLYDWEVVSQKMIDALKSLLPE